MRIFAAMMITILVGLSACSSRMTAGVLNMAEIRNFIPRPMRHQMFSNTPVGDIKNRDETKDEAINNATYDSAKGYYYQGYGQSGAYYQASAPQSSEYSDDSYGAGFEAGCDNMSGIIGAGTMRLIEPKIDSYRLSSDQWYLRGYQDASAFCTFSLDWETH